MLSEDFDKKIKEAADHHHPAYDEKAWSAMKKLLDRHMPEEKDDKRRYFFFLLLFLLLGGGAAWFFMSRGSGDDKNKRAVTVQAPVSGNENKQKPGNSVFADSIPPPANIEKPADQQSEEGIADKDRGTKANDTNENDFPIVTDPAGKDPLQTAYKGKTNPGAGKQKNSSKDNIPGGKVKNIVSPGTDTRTVKSDPPVTKTAPAEPVARKEEPTQDADAAVAVAVDATKNVVPSVMSKNKETEKVVNEEQKPQAVAVVKKEEKKQDEKTDVTKKAKKSPAKKSSFFFSVSGGPDVSFTGNDKPGRMQFVGGAGIGYSFKERFTLRSGFYSARKVYTSSPGQYNPPSIFYTYYPNLQKVEADCKVYEIPLSLGYHFGQQKKHSWFASAGVSTILMKRETYDYYYKYYPTGPTVQREHTFYNENKHFFSVMTLSAGYQRSLGKRISITAEPYFKLPLSGVGYGKVRLNSAGVLFSLSVKPFQRTEKK